MENSKKTLVNTMTLEDVLSYNGTPILKYSIEYPQFSSSEFYASVQKVNDFYKHKALDYEKYIRTTLQKEAIEAYKYNVQNGYPVFVYEAVERYELTYNQNCALSLYTDRYEYTGGAHGNTIRTSQTWNLKNGMQVPLEALFPNHPHYILHLKTEIKRQIGRQIQQGKGMYFDNYEELVDQTFNPKNFYLTPQALAIYFQQYDIAPYVSGIPTFMIPYHMVGAQPPTCTK